MLLASLNRYLRNYFGFTRLEERGFWVWTVGMVALVILNFCITAFDFGTYEPTEAQKTSFNLVLASLEKNSPEETYQTRQETNTNSVGERFMFNPNTTEETDLKRLGIPSRFVKSIIKFRSKGGKFKKKADLQRIYNFPADLYASLEPYIDLPTEAPRKIYAQTKDFSQAKPTIQSFDLNKADTATLSQVRGIGAKTAQSIVTYREKLGGFVALAQLNEVYLLKEKPEVVAELSRYAQIQTPAQKINVNTATLETLQAHPYFRKVAKAIVSYRTKAGKPFANAEELQKMKAITPEVWEKMKDYVIFQ